MRLGLTARVRDVDPTGRLAFVTHWRQAPRLFDLRQLRWVRDVRFSRGAYVWNRPYPPRLTGDGRLIYGEWSAGSGYERSESLRFDGMRVVSLGSMKSNVIASETPQRGTAVSAVGEYFYYVTETQRVAVIRGGETYAVEPLPRRVVQAAYIDGEGDLLAAASWSELVLCGLVDGKLAPLGRRKTETVGDVTWIGVAGRWLIAAVKRFGSATVVEVWRLDRDLTIGALERTHVMSELNAAAVSRDGRYLALAGGDGLRVYELATGNEAVFTEHTDRINLVRFASGDHTLISADTDNRVVLRPRTSTGYARPVIAIEVPADGAELPSVAVGEP